MFKARKGYEPIRKTRSSAGFDIRARGTYILEPYRVTLVRTGVWLDAESEGVKMFKESAFIMLTIRSSLARSGIMLANGVGIIDMDYKDEIGALLYNTNNDFVKITDKERIAQLILLPHLSFQRSLINAIFEDEDRTGGFGSTGK